MTRKQLEAKARKLAQKFYDDAQKIFDDPSMTDEISLKQKTPDSDAGNPLPLGRGGCQTTEL